MRQAVFLFTFLVVLSAFNLTDSEVRLMRAVVNGEADKVRLLMDNGVNVNCSDRNGETPLLLAVTYGYFEIVKMLLDHGADLNKANSEGMGLEKLVGRFPIYSSYYPSENALMRAARFNQFHIFKYLLDQGADPTLTTNGPFGRKHSLLKASVRGANLILIKYLIEKCNFPYKPYLIDESGFELMLDAAETNQTDLVKYLIQLGVDVNCASKNGIPLLFKIASSEHISLEILALLIDEGASTDFSNNSNITFLMACVKSKSLEKVKMAINAQNDIEARDIDGQTAIIIAATTGNQEIVEYLVDLGANVNAIDNKGYTALARAAGSQGDFDRSMRDLETHGGNLDMVKFLINKGANKNTISKNGENLVMYAASKGNLKLLRYLVEELKIDIEKKSTGGYYKGLTALGYAQKEFKISQKDNLKEVIDYLLPMLEN